MKNRFIYLVVIVFIGTTMFVAVQNDHLSDILLREIDSLAGGEGGEDSHIWSAPRTVSCDLRQGKWHTASVERICEFCVTPNSCIPIRCGGDF
ncbi:hypothetical protein [Bacteroides graminisolvens]|jgi:hypothetical protein|uniref:hypothetical protein n=1 Tax=Bacteroides graminisolvens TaxID=477666 RepID=UPI00240930E6|nr:hypothetical protein [Bacteroides graminisolvens]